MAFRRRFRRTRRFGRRNFVRKTPAWITTAYNVAQVPQVTAQQLFQLVGPEDYIPDYTTEPQRLDRNLLVRTVGSFKLIPVFPTPVEAVPFVVTAAKGALFVAGDKQVDDGFANDPGQFEITSPTVFPTFCRDFAPMHIFWGLGAEYRGNNSVTNDFRWWLPPAETLSREWDVTVRRKLQGDDALWLLLDVVFLQSEPSTFGGAIDVESRNLLAD